MSRLAVMKGETNDEIRRNKDKARKTMQQLKSTKKVGDGGSSPDRTTKGGFTTTLGGSGFIDEDSPINLLLGFGSMKKSGAFNQMLTSSLGNTMSSNSNYINVILPLK